jgi:hypothetical protein
MSGIRWKPGKSPRDLAKAIERKYGVSKHVAAAGALATSFSPKLEAHAKRHAPWTDRTGNARQTLFSVVDVQKDKVILYLSHGVEYGVFLELCNEGRYAIVMKTLQAHYPQVKQAMDDLYRG